MKPIKYGSTGQFRNVVKQVQEMSAYQGSDEMGNPIFDYHQPKPIIDFRFSVKLHGTNASVVVTPNGDLFTQSRNGIFDPTKQPDSHMGFTQFILSKNTEDEFEFTNGLLLTEMVNRIRLDKGQDNNTYIIYGEWAGKGIQKGVAVSELEKAFYIFGVKVKPFEEGLESTWLGVDDVINYFPSKGKIRNLWQLDNYTIPVDFSQPEIAQNKIVELVEKVEAMCPISDYFGSQGIGEGVVGVGEYKGQRLIFKAKGEKHSKGSKVKTTKSVDTAKIAAQLELADKVTPVWRLDQFYTEISQEENQEVLERKFIGKFINRVKADIVKEDMDIILESGIDFKNVIRHLGDICRGYFFNREKF